MSEESKTVWAVCPSCGPNRKADIIAEHSELEEMPGMSVSFSWGILQCRGCELVFFITSNSDPDSFGEPQYYPKRPVREQPEWLKSSIFDFNSPSIWKERLIDFYGCMNARLLVPAAVAGRTVFDVATRELDIDPKLSFEKKLLELVNQGHISSKERDNLKALIEAGSAAAHRGWEPTLDELQMIAGILEAFIERTFVQKDLPEAMLARIPSRKK